MRWLYANLEEVLGTSVLAVVGLTAVIQVAGRYLLRHPLGWTEELSSMLLVYLAMIGASLALKQGEHFAVQLFVDCLPRTLRKAVHLGGWLLVSLFALLLLVTGWKLASGAWHVQTAGLELPRTLPYAAVPLGGALMLLRSVQGLSRCWRMEAQTTAGGGQ
jgi:TRAP-type C4-dicarboxylate transport system permease small subunit